MALPSTTPTTKYGVLYTPFQVSHVPTDTHGELLKKLHQRHEVVIIALPVKRISPSKSSPLDFKTRKEMLEVEYENIHHIVPVVDRKYAADQIEALHYACSAQFSSFGNATLYTTSSFGPIYKQNGGKWPVYYSYDDLDCDLLEAELANRNAVRAACRWPETEDVMEYFRRGIIFGLNHQFPISWPTVDFAVKRLVNGKIFYLLGKKPGETNWRFPGGFKDRGDNGYEMSVIREGSEEVLEDTIVVASTVFTHPNYITSRNVNDWRYRDEIDGITTAFYEIEFIGKDDQIKAGDDLSEVKWLALEDMKRDDMEGEHVYLFDALMQYNKM